MLVFLSILIIILWITAFSLKIGIKGEIDIFSNEGIFAVRFLGIKIYKAKIFFEIAGDRNILIIERKKKKKIINLKRAEKIKDTLTRALKNQLSKLFFSSLVIKKLEIEIRAGKDDDAFFTTLLLSSLKVALYSGLAYLKNRYPQVDIKENFIPEFNNDIINAEFFGIISISFADIISSILIKIKNIFKIKNKILRRRKVDIRTK